MRRARPRDTTEPRPTIDAFALEGFRRGDEDAARDMYRTYGNLVYAVAFCALGRRELAEEATQQTFVRAWQGMIVTLESIDDDQAPSSDVVLAGKLHRA